MVVEFQTQPLATKFAVSLISGIACFSIVLSFIVFKKKIKTKKVMELYLYIFVSYLMANVASMVELSVVDDTDTCLCKRLVSNALSLAAIVWTVLVLLLLYSNVAFTKPIKISKFHHIFCWGIPALSSVLPLAGGSSKLVWSLISFYVVIYSCLFATAIISLQYFYHLQHVPMSATVTKLKSIFIVVVAYPIVYFLCWLPTTVVDMLSILHPETNLSSTTLSITTGLTCSTGLWSALVFWVSNDHARNMWLSFIMRVVVGNAESSGLYRQSSLLSASSVLNTIRMKPAELSVKVVEVNLEVNNLVRRFSGLVETMANKRRPTLLQNLRYLSGLNAASSPARVVADLPDDSGRTGDSTQAGPMPSPFPEFGAQPGVADVVPVAETDASHMLIELLGRPLVVIDYRLVTPSPCVSGSGRDSGRGSGKGGEDRFLGSAQSARSASIDTVMPADGCFDLDIERGSVRPILPVKYGCPDVSPG